MNIWPDFHGPNAGYVLELYERYRQNPDSVDAATKASFAMWTPAVDGAPAVAAPAIGKIVGAVTLAQAIRTYGHLAAQLDPLGSPPPGGSIAGADDPWRNGGRPSPTAGQPH